MQGSNNPSGPRSGSPETSWSERKGRIVTALVIAAVLIGTPILSMTIFSVGGGAGTITIEPGSYRAMHFMFYGLGKLEYSVSGESGYDSHLLEMDRSNYQHFVDGKPYHETSYESIGFGGSGSTSETGLLWDDYLVFVNDGSSTAVIHYEIHAESYFNMLAAGMILAAAVGLVFVAYRFSTGHNEVQMSPVDQRSRSMARRKATLAFVVLALAPIAIMWVLGQLLSSAIDVGSGVAFLRLLVGVIVAMAIAFSLRFRLQVVKLEPRQALDDIAHRLRVSGYRVSDRRMVLSVRGSSISATNIRAKQSPEGTLITYQASATPLGWGIILVMLYFLNTFSPIPFILVLFVFYKSVAFAINRVLPRLSQLPIPSSLVKEHDTRAMLIDGLSEGRRISSETYEAARSNYHDNVIVVVIFALILSSFTAVLLGYYAFQDVDSQLRVDMSFASGVLIGVVLSLVSWRFLARKSKPILKDLKSWETRFNVALSHEVSSAAPSDSEPSSFELIAESLKEVPNWLKILRKAGMFRQPIQWFLIFFATLMSIELAFTGLLELASGQGQYSVLPLAVSVALGCLVAVLYLTWRRRIREESKSTIGSWSARFEALKTEMETYLRGV
jgi:hypothetical protein